MNDMTGRPADDAAQLERALGLLALHLRHEVALARALRGEGSGPTEDAFLGLFLTDSEAGRIADGLAAGMADIPGAADIARIWSAIRAERRGIWTLLADRLDLAQAEADLLLLAAAPAVDPRFGRVYGYLNDDLARRYLTPALALRLLRQGGLDQLTLRRMLDPAAPLCACGLVAPEPRLPFIDSPLRIDEPVLDLLMGAGLPEMPARLDRLAVPRGERPAPAGVAVIDAAAGDPGEAVLAVAGAAGCDIGLADGDGFARMSPDDRPAALRRLWREARLHRLLPVFADTPEFLWHRDGGMPEALPGDCIVISRTPQVWLDRVPRARLRRAAGAVALPVALTAAGGQGLPLYDRMALVARHRGGAPLEQAAGLRNLQHLASLADRLWLSFTLDDLVAPPATRRALEAVVARHRHDAQVLGDWGLGAVMGKAPGMTLLFKGPSGTGKTMAASVLGRCLDLPVFRVSLAALVSKYIGETEKNLDRLFAAADRCEVVLFFDEADAMFGKRTEVEDAHDRYANLETSYLLQRLETHRGIAVLASNLHQNIDEAFLRRIDRIVEFPAPDAAQRAELWRRGLRSDAPVADDVDLDFLAGGFDLTGGEIRNCWLDAAYRAAEAGQVIGMAHLLAAVAAECVKQGRAVRRSDFGAHFAQLKREGW